MARHPQVHLCITSNRGWVVNLDTTKFYGKNARTRVGPANATSAASSIVSLHLCHADSVGVRVGATRHDRISKGTSTRASAARRRVNLPNAVNLRHQVLSITARSSSIVSLRPRRAAGVRVHVGAACQSSDAVTCSGAGTVDAATGACACNDGSGYVGAACQNSDAVVSSGAGTVDVSLALSILSLLGNGGMAVAFSC